MDETQGDEGIVPRGARTLWTRPSRSSPKNGSHDDCASTTSGSAGAGTPDSRDNSPDLTLPSGFDAILNEIQELQENQGQLQECFENFKAHQQREHTVIVEALQEEQYRCENFEEQLNDLTELHQNEMFNIKEELSSLEEMIADQSYDGERDIYEALEACQTRLFKMEHLEGLENVKAQARLEKVNTVLLSVLAVLVSVSTAANCLVALMKTYSRTLSTLLLVVLLSFLWRQGDAISEYVQHFFCTQYCEKGDK